MSKPELSLLNMIRALREEEKVTLYGNLLTISAEDFARTTDFLKSEYERERPEHLQPVPNFHPEAAKWAAQITYTAAQLILYRSHKEQELTNMLPDYTGDYNASAILSSDLCLRFLPGMIARLTLIDSEDPLTAHLSSLLSRWHYSGIGSRLIDLTTSDFTFIMNHRELLELYCERIIQRRDLSLAILPEFNSMINAQLGIYAPELWREFKRIKTTHE